jgi:hypothetical protein
VRSLLVLVTVVTLGATSCSKGGHSKAIDDGAREMVALINRGRTTTMHARYTLRAQGLNATLEIWRRPPRTRQDTTIALDGAPSRTSATFTLPSGNTTCERSGTEAWSCQKGGGGEPAPSEFIDQITAQLKGVPVTATTERIDARQARCFAMTVAGEAVRFCLTNAGLPVLVDSQEGTMRLIGTDNDIPEAVFAPPA